MEAYHEANPNIVSDILENGLKRKSRGEKGDDKYIIKTDRLLDDLCPKELKQKGVSRDNNIYAYVKIDDSIVDIVDGDLVDFDEFVHQSNQAVLELTVNPSRCFISDLDTYDALKAAVKSNEGQQTVQDLVTSYWNKLTKLSEFSLESIKRPEIMITFDIPPQDIQHIN